MDFYNQDGKRVGYRRGNRYIRIAHDNHILKRPVESWAIDEAILARCKADGVEAVEIYNMDSRKRYTATVEDYLVNGFLVNRGHGIQIALPLARFDEADFTEI